MKFCSFIVSPNNVNTPLARGHAVRMNIVHTSLNDIHNKVVLCHGLYVYELYGLYVYDFSTPNEPICKSIVL